MLDRSTPRPVRLAIYALHDSLAIGRAVLRAPTRRESYGRLLNLPKFGTLVPALVHRSAEPRTLAHWDHVARLGIRTLICVRGGGPSASTIAHVRALGLQLLTYDLGADSHCDTAALQAAVEAALSGVYQPTLIHCDGGRHRAGMVSALVRHRQGWSISAIVDEYRTFAQPSPYEDNVDIIFRCMGVPVKKSGWVPPARAA